MSLESFSDRLGDDVKSKRSSPSAKGA